MLEIDQHLCGQCQSFKEILLGEGLCFSSKLPKPFATLEDKTTRQSLQKADLLAEITQMELTNSTCFEPTILESSKDSESEAPTA